VTGSDGQRGDRLLARAKSNLGPDTGGFTYRLEHLELAEPSGVPAMRVVWGEFLEGTARTLLAQGEAIEDQGERSATDEAVDWLRDVLAQGPMRACDVQTEARQAGITNKALRRARERLGIKPRKAAFSGGWEWGLPASKTPQSHEDAQGARFQSTGTFGGVGHLRAEGEEFEEF